MRSLFYRVKNFWLTGLIAGLCLMVLASPILAGADDLKSKTKAVFIFKLFHYVTWPKSEKDQTGAMLCVYGQNSFPDTLSYLQKKKPGLKIKTISDIKSAGDCHLLFIGTMDSAAEEYIKKPDQTGTLIVSDVPKSFDNGGMIFMFYENDRLQLYINRTRLHKAGFKINSKLLRHARIVK